MESVSYNKRAGILNLLQEIERSILLLEDWNADITSVDDYLLSPEGAKSLAANCMLIGAIGEGFKKIDKDTDKKLLVTYPDIPWDDVKGMRDHIAHGYFDIDAEIIYQVIKEDLASLKEAVRYFIRQLDDFDL